MVDIILDDPDEKKNSGNVSDSATGKEQDVAKSKQKSPDEQGDNGETEVTVSAEVKNAKNNNTNAAGRDVYQQIVNNIHHHHYHYEDEKKKRDERKSKLGDAGISKAPKNLEEAFNQLDLGQQIFFLTMCFFEGLKVNEYNQVYRSILNSIAEDLFSDEEKRELNRGFLKPIPNPKGLEICQEYDSSKLANVYKFKQKDTAQKLFAFAVQKYATLLSTYVIALRILIEGQKNFDIRQFAAIALGDLSKEDFEQVIQDAIVPLCISNKDTARVSVAYFFAYLFDNHGTNQDIQYRLRDLLEHWTTQPGWLWKWTVAATSERLGLSEKPDLESFSQELLDKLARTDNVRVANAVIHALVGWSLNDKITTVVDILKTWVDEGSAGKGNTLSEYEVRCVVGIWAFWRIVWVHQSLLKSPPPDLLVKPVDMFSFLRQNGKLNPILVSVGIRSFECGLGNDFLDNLVSLIELDNRNEMQSFVVSWIQEVYRSLSIKTTFRSSIKGMINNYWARSKNADIKKIAQQLQNL